MLISVVNHTKGKLSDERVQEGIRAVNRQIAHDFRPHWDSGAELRLEGAIGAVPDEEKLPELRGDAILYLWDEAWRDLPRARRKHDRARQGRAPRRPGGAATAPPLDAASRRRDDRSGRDASRPGRGLKLKTARDTSC